LRYAVAAFTALNSWCAPNTIPHSASSSAAPVMCVFSSLCLADTPGNARRCAPSPLPRALPRCRPSPLIPGPRPRPVPACSRALLPPQPPPRAWAPLSPAPSPWSPFPPPRSPCSRARPFTHWQLGCFGVLHPHLPAGILAAQDEPEHHACRLEAHSAAPVLSSPAAAGV
jgi:hypothetical protein